MRSQHIPFSLLVLAAILAAPAPSRAQPPSFSKDLRPLLMRSCFQCHNPDDYEARIDLSDYTAEDVFEKDPLFWFRVLTQVRDRVMPPAKAKVPLSEIDRQKIVDWLTHRLDNLDPSKIPKDPGHTPPRRLNRAEYNNTVRDWLGVESHPADEFPADGAGGGGFNNNADTLFIPPVLMERYLQAADSIVTQIPRKRLATTRPSATCPKRQAARLCLQHHLRLAFRRPPTPLEVDRYLTLFDIADARKASFDDALRLPIKAMLISPQFLFRIEADRGLKTPWRISDLELASRLSYFLWSSMPDEELLSMAEQNRLSDPATLEKQVRRMLKDPRARALSENFGAQWLGISDFRTTAEPDRVRFRAFTSSVRDAMYQEAVLFIDSVLREDQPLTRLLDADYTFVNHDLARHYGIPGVSGEDMRRVTVPVNLRGGLLGLGAIQVITSYPLRTSPVLRGKWILDVILGAPPSPPPPNAGKLPQDDRSVKGATLRQQLEQHRRNPACATCHNRLDPPGFALENYDPIGRWRTTQNGLPIDSAGQLPTGEHFNGVGELKHILLTHKDPFIRNVVQRLLAYALARGLDPTDQPTVIHLCKTLSQHEFRSTTLILEICRSYPFTYRRTAGTETRP